jgi:thiamine transport system permease protein
MSTLPQILPPRPWRIGTATLLAGAIGVLVVCVLWAILGAATNEPDTGFSRLDILHLLRMTALQAGLSTGLSLVAGIALAWCLNRLRFPGRDLVIGLFAAAIVTPGLVVAFGLLSIWGRNGWINRTVEALFGLSIGNIAFGLGGILLAHLVLNGAFAARVLLARLDAIPAARLKIGQSLGLGPLQRFAIIDWPAIRGTLPGLGAIIFLLTFTSFPIVLLLGGGPGNQTLEVAIFAAVRSQFDLRGAVWLAIVQIIACSLVILMASAAPPVPSHLGPSAGQGWRDRSWAFVLQWLLLAIFGIGFAAPLLAVLAGGIAAVPSVVVQPTFWWSTLTSLVIGTLSAGLTLALALTLGMGRAASAHPLLRTGLGLPIYAYLAVPAVVLSLGFFLLVRSLGIAPSSAAPVVVVIANALLALPFAAATLGPPLDAIARTRGKLIRSLGLNGARQFSAVEYPLLGRDIGVVTALAFCFSLGDLGVIALFGTQDFQTLPLMMYRALGSYRTNDAGAIAAILLVVTIAAFVILPRLIESLSHARD